MMPRWIQILVGASFWAAALVFLLKGATDPAVAAPTAQMVETVASALDVERDEDLRLPVWTTEGIRIGEPVYVIDAAGDAHPMGWVTRVGAADVHVRAAPGEPERASDDFELQVHPPRRGLKHNVSVAVPPESAERLKSELIARAGRLWTELLEPDLKARLPNFIVRVDPTTDPKAREVLGALGTSVMTELRPLIDSLGNHIAKALDKHFGFLDRMGLLWKVVRGDMKGLKKQVLPVAEKSAKAWFDSNQQQVMKALGRGIGRESGRLQAWLTDEVFRAAREELIEPILEVHDDRLAKEGEALLRLASDELVQAPSGGFRVRFAHVLRATLLRKKTSLLVLVAKSAEPR